jgi:hypothetical protein
MLFRNPDGSSRVEYAPVKITRWAPGERVYGQAQDQPKEHQHSEESTSAMPARRAS